MPKKTSSKNKVARDKDYQNLLADLKNIIAKGQYQAFKAVDKIRPQEVFKESYTFDFIEFHTDPDEKEFENKILSNFEKFLHELGEGFYIIGRQVPINIDRQTHFIDMVLYHREIQCIVLVDLKVGKLDSRDIGQMNKYIGYWRRNKQSEHEQPAIGLIICREAGREEVIYALEGLEEKIFIAKYKAKLPGEAKIKKVLKDP
jgi:predicted nuclease of restriction endonuclease-like (RecB) superfamily